MTNIVSPQNHSFILGDGYRPANNGTLYIGKAGTDPTVTNNQIAVNGRKVDGTISALTQPISLDSNGKAVDGTGTSVDLLVDTHYSFAVYDAYGKLSQSVSTQLVLEVDGFSTLRNLPVIYEGQRVKLLGWNKESQLGGGDFIGHLSSAVDDSGSIASSGGKFHWERISNGELLPEQFGAMGDGVTDDTVALQAALSSWKGYPNLKFNAFGIYLISSTLIILSPTQGSNCFINTLIKSATWTDKATSLFKRTGALITLDVDSSNPTAMWGSKIEIGYLQDLTIKSSPLDYSVHGIMNLGWQQCEVNIGLAQGLLTVVYIANTKSTTPTVNYSIRMARGNLINYYAPYNITNMFEGCNFRTMWSSGGMFCAEMLGNGSAYTHIIGGSADFAGGYLNYVTLNTLPTSIATGDEVTNSSGSVIGWVIGFRYYPNTRATAVIIAELSDISSTTGVPASTSLLTVGSSITFSGATYTVSTVSSSNNSHTVSRFLPTSICTATTAQTIVRWRITRDYDSGVIFPNDIYYSDSFINTTNEVIRRKVPLPLGSNFDSGISNGQLIINGNRYATRLQVNNLEVVSPGGFNTAKHSSVWKMTGSTGQNTVLVSDGTSTTTVAFTLIGLGGGTVTGRISGRSTDPATDTIGLWEITGFGTNVNGTVAIDKWDVLWNGGTTFYITKSVSGTNMALSGTLDSNNAATLTLTGGLTTAQAVIGASWQYRATALRKMML